MLQAARQDPRIMRDCLRRAALDFIAAKREASPVLAVFAVALSATLTALSGFHRPPRSGGRRCLVPRPRALIVSAAHMAPCCSAAQCQLADPATAAGHLPQLVVFVIIGSAAEASAAVAHVDWGTVFDELILLGDAAA